MAIYWFGVATGGLAILALRAALHQEWMVAAEGIIGVIGITLLMFTSTKPPQVAGPSQSLPTAID
jgi:hypothetical protein